MERIKLMGFKRYGGNLEEWDPFEGSSDPITITL